MSHGLFGSFIWGFVGRVASAVGSRLVGSVNSLTGLSKKVVQPVVDVRILTELTVKREKPLPFRVIPPTQKDDKGNPLMNVAAFALLPGADFQQSQIKVLVSLNWNFWRELESSVRDDVRQRIAFVLFTGAMGTGKTRHAEALADFLGIPCIHLDAGNATFVNADGLTMMRQVVDYCRKLRSALLLLDEFDAYAADPRFAPVLRQTIDGACKIPEECVLYIVATTNKPIAGLPPDLLHRVLMHVSFDNEQAGQTVSADCLDQGDLKGWCHAQCLAFWEQNAKCLSRDEREVLASCSIGLVPRDLQLWVQRVLLSVAANAALDDDGQQSDCPHLKLMLQDFEEHGPPRTAARSRL